MNGGRWHTVVALAGLAAALVSGGLPAGGAVAVAAGGADGLQPDGSLRLSDPEGDDHGPGTYRYPIDARLPVGSFDLTSFELRPAGGGEGLELEACFRVRPLPIPRVRVSAYEEVDLLPQAIDVYLDTDGRPDSGLTRALPGREVRLAPGFAWERALAMVPRAPLYATWLAGVDAELAARTALSDDVRQRGRCVTARFPRPGVGRPQPGWGVLVLVSGARFYPTFGVKDWALGQPERDDFTRDVLPKPGSCLLDDNATFDCVFGGCKPCGHHPRVIDALLCGSQESALASYDPPSGRLAELAGVRLSADGAASCGAAAEATAPAAPSEVAPAGAAPAGYRLADLADGLLSIVGGEPRQDGEFGEVLGPQGQVLARVVVTGRAGAVILAQRVGAGEAVPLQAGMVVRFGGQREVR